MNKIQEEIKRRKEGGPVTTKQTTDTTKELQILEPTLALVRQHLDGVQYAVAITGWDVTPGFLVTIPSNEGELKRPVTVRITDPGRAMVAISINLHPIDVPVTEEGKTFVGAVVDRMYESEYGRYRYEDKKTHEDFEPTERMDFVHGCDKLSEHLTKMGIQFSESAAGNTNKAALHRVEDAFNELVRAVMAARDPENAP